MRIRKVEVCKDVQVDEHVFWNWEKGEVKTTQYCNHALNSKSNDQSNTSQFELQPDDDLTTNLISLEND